MLDLYRTTWERLRIDRERCPDIDPECTPVLVFGNWRSARIATAGLNPSEDEFWTKPTFTAERQPLRDMRQRFLHWGDGTLTDDRLREAFRRMEGYFTLGNAYSLWFDRYQAFLNALGTPFESGLACHTDYVSPFATKVGISKCCPATRRLLPEFGEQVWLNALDNCPCLEVVFGHGRGWHRVPNLFTGHSDWEHVPTPFDSKGGKSAGQHLIRSSGVLPSGRRVAIWWWRPNRDGSPLCYLKASEGAVVGTMLKSTLESR
jgi:hypothetical protein